ncbi:hypothetical protein [Actinopolyspora lacussalsi]
MHYSGTFLADPLEVPAAVLDLLAGQLNDAALGGRHENTPSRPGKPGKEWVVSAVHRAREAECRFAGTVERSGLFGFRRVFP